MVFTTLCTLLALSSTLVSGQVTQQNTTDGVLPSNATTGFIPLQGQFPYRSRINSSAPIVPPVNNLPIPKYYSSLIGFGDSFSDNAHPRLITFQASYCVGPGYVDPNGGRCSNGPIALDYMAFTNQTVPLSLIPIQTIDYAYSGSFVSNAFARNALSVTPSFDQQTGFFISDLAAGNIVVNSVTSRDIAFLYLIDIVNEFGGAGLEANRIRAMQDVDNLILAYTVIAKNLYFQVQKFNTGIEKIAQDLKNTATSTDRVFFADLSGLWNELFTNSATFGIPDPRASCIQNGVCANGATFLTMEGIHPVTTIQFRMANFYNQIIMAATGYLQ